MIGGRNPNAWNNWYHAVGSTHGTWIRGDPRGFRTFRHRVHVEGDYKQPPPPGIYAPIFEYSKRKLRYPPIRLDPAQRQFLCDGLIEGLLGDGVEVIALTVAMNHFHLLARFPLLTAEQINRYGQSILRDGRDPAPRHRLGLARKHASEQLAFAGLKPPGPVWGARPKFDPIRDRAHQINLTGYILDHVRQGAAVYRLPKRR